MGDTFVRGGIVAQVTPHIQSFEWSKYVAWVCLMAPAVLTRLESAKILQDPQMASITAAILHEMAQIATIRGMALHDIALFPTKTLSQLAFDDTVTHVRQIGDRWASLLPTAKVSTLHDVEQGKRLEVEETLGYAVRQECSAWYSNANDGHLLQTDRRDQSLISSEWSHVITESLSIEGFDSPWSCLCSSSWERALHAEGGQRASHARPCAWRPCLP